MLFNGFARPLHLRRKSSRLLAAYLVALHVLALIALLQPLAIATYVRVLLYLAWIVSAVVYCQYYRRQQDDASNYWVWQKGGGWLKTGDTNLYSLISAQSLQTPWFVLVTLTSPGQARQRLLIYRDQLDTDSFRRLRVRLKLYHDEATATREESV